MGSAACDWDVCGSRRACKFHHCTLLEWVTVPVYWDLENVPMALLGITAIEAALSARPVEGINGQPQIASPESGAQKLSEQYELGDVPAKVQLVLTDNIRLNPPENKGRKLKNYSLHGQLINFPGLVAGPTGLFSLVKQNWHSLPALQLITYTMWSITGSIGALFVVFAVLFARGLVERTSVAFESLIGAGITVQIVGMVEALYSD